MVKPLKDEQLWGVPAEQLPEPEQKQQDATIRNLLVIHNIARFIFMRMHGQSAMASQLRHNERDTGVTL
jgi:hypothetical protein